MEDRSRAPVDLQALAVETKAALAGIWDEVGVPTSERETFLAQLVADVASIYTMGVRRQDDRRSAIRGEISTLIDTLRNMQYAMDESARGIPERPVDATLIQYRDTLESTRSELQKLWDSRDSRLQALFKTLHAVHDDIVEAVPQALSDVGSKMSLARITEYEAGIAAAETIKIERGAIIVGLCEEILELWADMSFTPADDFEAHIPEKGVGLGWGTSIIDTLNAKLAELNEERSVREARIDAMGKELTNLWKRLQTPEGEQTSFLEAHMGLGDDVLGAVEVYLTNKRAEFTAKLVDLIASARASIVALWDEMRAGPTQRQSMFAPFYTDVTGFSETLYEAHEAYIAMLGKALEDVKPLLKGIEKRDELKGDKAEYEAIIADATRLARGSSAARLREEKLERRVKKELPAVSKRLRQQIVEWEAASGRRFLVNDEVYLDVLDGDEAAETRAKEDAKAARDAKKAETNVLAASAGPAVTAETMKSASAAGSLARSTSVGRISLYKGASASAVAPSAPAASGAASRRGTAAAISRKASVTAAAGGSSIASAAADAAVDAASAAPPAPAAAAAPAAPLTSRENVSSGRGVPGKAGAEKTIAPPTVPTEAALPIATVAAITVSEAAKASAARMLQML